MPLTSQPASLTDAVFAEIAALPAVLDLSAPREELELAADRVGRVGTLMDRAQLQERADYLRLQAIGKRLTVRNRPGALECIQRMLDTEHALNLLRAWFDANMPTLHEARDRMGDATVAAALSDSALALSRTFPPERYELRAWLRRTQRQVHGTPRQRVEWQIRRVATAALRALAKTLRDFAMRHAPEQGSDPPP
jgi:hypothetical protein